MSLESALSAFGLVFDSIIADGEIHRCGTLKKPRSRNGWYSLHPSGKFATFGNWELGDSYEKWENGELSSGDYTAMRQATEALKAAREKQYESAAHEAAAFFESCAAEGFSDYLKNKRIYPHGARFDGNALIIPAQDAEGKIWSYQRILADGSKYFMHGGRVRGCYYPIFPARNVSKKERIVVCEGFATGASIHQETGLPVIVAFNAGNLKAVCDSLPYSDLLIAADNDKSGVGEKSAQETGRPYVMPKIEGFDYSDLFLEGKNFKDDFLPKQEVVARNEPIRAHGLVQEIADWITETAGFPMPLLSLGAAIAFVSMLKGHVVEGGTELRTNNLILNMAPTGAGKDYPQKCLNKLVAATMRQSNRMGEPVSGGAFLTGLLKANRVGILIMDEMGHYIGNITNKSSGTHQKEIIGYILKTFSCASTYLPGRQYTDDKKNPCVDIQQPHFVCVGSTVHEKMKDACTSSDVVDGFLARWIIFNVKKRVERSQQRKKAIPPEELVEKIMAMKKPEYDSYGEPMLKEVTFTPEAWEIFSKHRDEMDKMIATATYPMDKLYVRTSEHVEKIALTLCEDDWISPRDVLAAIAIVSESNRCIMEFTGLISDNVFEKDFIRVREIIKEAREIKKSALTMRCQFVQGGAKRVREIVETLIDAHVITERKHLNGVIYKYVGS